MINWSQDKVFTIAEIGGNHEGSFEKALELLNLAKETGFDAIKFQIYSSKNLVNAYLDADRSKHFKKFELKKEEYIELANLTKESGLMFMSSLWDIKTLDFFDQFIDVHKIGSGDLTAYPLIKEIVLKNKPTILSTGLSSMDEIIETINFIKSIDSEFIKNNKLALLQCTSMYPTPDNDASLNSMNYMKDFTKLPVGYSDHTVGSEAIETAVEMGARIIEKHFTDKRDNTNFRDHMVSLNKDEMQKFIKKIKKIHILKGKYEKKIMESEKVHFISFRRAAYINRKMIAGDILMEKDLEVLRPNEGISAKFFFDLIGKKLKKDIQPYEKLEWEYFE